MSLEHFVILGGGSQCPGNTSLFWEVVHSFLGTLPYSGRWFTVSQEHFLILGGISQCPGNTSLFWELVHSVLGTLPYFGR